MNHFTRSWVSMQQTVSRGIAVFLFVVALMGVFASTASAAAGVPRIMNYQGRLMNAGGTLLGGSGTEYCVKFSLYDDATVGGPDTKLWPSGSPSTMTVTVRNGIFNVGIGDTGAGGDVLDFNFQDNDATYLNVQVATKVGATCAPGDGAESFENLSPRQRVTAAGYAVNSATVGGYTAAQLMANSYSTTSAAYNLSTYDKGYFFSTTSVTFWDSLQYRWATTSSDAWFATRTTDDLAQGVSNLYYSNTLVNAFVGGSSTIAKSFTNNTFTGVNAFQNDTTLTNATTSNFNILNTISGAGLTSCSGSADKLTWNAATRQFACGADAGAGGGITAIGAQYSVFQTGASQTFATSSDTNLGITITSSGDTHTFTPTWQGVLAGPRGGTGISSVAASGLLIGGAGNTWTQVGTSSLGLPTFNDLNGFLSLSGWYATTTDALSEGVNNLYYTNGRVAAVIAGTTTDALSEGVSNRYYTDGRVQTYLDTVAKPYFFSTSSAAFNLSTYDKGFFFSTTSVNYWESTQNRWATTSANAWLATKSTTDLPEGSNLYYTPNRVAGVIAGTTTDALAEGVSNQYFTLNRFASVLAGTTTDALPQGVTNRYYSNTLVQTYLDGVNKGFFFSTSSADAWKAQTNFHSTSSFAFNLGTYDKGYFFSTTSVNFWESTQSRWATTSSDAWLATKSTTDIPEGLNLYFSVNRVAGVIAGTTTDALAEGATNRYYSNGLVQTYLNTVDKGFFFSTTSAAYYASQNPVAFSTSSANYYMQASSTIPKTYTNNTFTGSNDFQNVTATGVTSTASFATTASSSNLFSNIANIGSLVASVFSGTTLTATNATTTTLVTNTASTTALNANNVSAGAANIGSLTLGNALTAGNGGTGINSVSENGILIGGAGNTWTQVSTSSLGLPTFATLGSYFTLANWYATTTDALDEGVTNFYFTSNRFASALAATTTDALAEGATNKYYSDARVQTYLDGVNKAFFFSTSSSDYWKTQNNFFSTSSATFFASAGLSFSTTSADYWKTQSNFHSTSSFAYNLSTYDKGYFFSTTSVAFWDSTQNRWATTSADYWATQRNFFSTSSAAYFSAAGLSFSTSSTDYWKAQNNFFSTSSASYFSSLGLAFSTSSAQYFLGQNTGNAFSTTSADYYVSSSSTIPKTYTNNTFTGTNTFGNVTATNATTTNSFASLSSSTETRANTAILGSVTAGSSTITATSTTNGLFATFSRLIASVIDSLTANVLVAYNSTFGNITATSSATLASTTAYGRFITGNVVATSSATSTFNGPVTIGILNGSYRMSVLGSTTAATGATGTAVMAISNNDNTLSSGNNVLRLNIRTPYATACTSATTCPRFEEYFAGVGAGSDTGGRGVGSLRLSTAGTGITQTSGAADFAEFMQLSESATVGDIVSLNASGEYRKAVAGESLIGVVSDNAAFVGNANIEGNTNAHIVGFAGVIRTKVSDANGAINAGDLIAASNVPGVGVKLNESGFALGQALQSFSGGNGEISVLVFPKYVDASVALESYGGGAQGVSGYWDLSTSTGFVSLASSTYALSVATATVNTLTTIATTTGSNGFNITAGCFAVNGTCIQSGSSLLGAANTWTGLNTFNGGVVLGNATSTALNTNVLGLGGLNYFTSLTGSGLLNSSGVLTLDRSGDWTGTFDGREGAYYLANSFSTSSAQYFLSQNQASSFSTSSADYWKTQSNFHSTSSFAFNLSTYDKGFFFSTTSVNYWESTQNRWATTSANAWLATKSTTDLPEGSNLYYTPNRVAGVIAGTTTDALAEGSSNRYYNDTRVQTYLNGISKGFFFSTSSSDYWKSQNNFFSTTSSDYWKSQNNFFSTSSANYFSSAGLSFSTTSTDYWRSVNNFFSTTSASHFSALGLAFSTTSAQYFLGQNIGNAFSTTSANAYMQASTTIPKTYTNNTFTGSNDFQNVTATGVTSTASFASTASSSNLFSNIANIGTLVASVFTGNVVTATNATTTSLAITNVSNALLKTNANGSVVAAVAGTDYLNSTAGNWSGTFDGQEGAYYLANAFSTSSAAFNLSTYDKGFFFSTTSVNYWESTQNRWATTSANAWLATKSTTDLPEGSNLYYTPNRVAGVIAGTTTDALAEGSSNRYYNDTRVQTYLNGISKGFFFSTSSSDYWKSQNNFFSTSSASFFSAAGLSFSTSSTDFWQSQRNFFSTTSASHFSSLGLAFSTTSAQYFLGQNTGNAFSTTSANAYMQASSTVPKTYTNNTFTGTNAFGNITATGATTTSLSTGSASTTNLTISSILNSLLYTGPGGVVAAAGVSAPLSFSGGTLSIQQGTATQNGYISSADWNLFNSRLSTTTLGLFDKGYFFSTTSTDYYMQASTTVPTTYKNNTFIGVNAFANITATGATSTSFFTGTASSTNLFANTARFGSLAAFTLSGSISAAGNNITGAATASSSDLVVSNLRNAILSTNAQGAVVATSTPTAASFIATSTSVASQLPYASSTALSALQQISIGAANGTVLQGSVAGTSTIAGFLSVGGTNSTSTFAGAISASRLNLTAGTSTAAGGINLTAGCFAINGVCLSGAVNSVSASNTSLTVSPNSGNVLVALNLANPNVWTGLQTFGNATSTSFEAFRMYARTIVSTSTNALQLQSNVSSTAGLTFGSTSTPQMLGIDTINSRVKIGTGIGSDAPSWLVLDTKNTAGDPATPGTAGAMYYNSVLGAFRCYSTSWVTCGGQAASSTGDVQFRNVDGSFTATNKFNWSLASNTLVLTGASSTQATDIFAVASSSNRVMFALNGMGIMSLSTTTDPVNPPEGELNIYAKDIAGRVMPKWTGPSGVDTPFQAGLGFNRTALMMPAGGATATTFIGGYGTLFTNTVTTAANPTPATTNLLTSTRRATFSTSATANTITYHRQNTLMVTRGNAAGIGGFFYTIRFGTSVTQTGNRAFVGLSDSIANPTNLDPLVTGTGVGRVGVAINASTGNWSFVHNVAGTAPTVFNLGTNFAVSTSTLYELVLFARPNDSVIRYRVKNLNTGFELASTTLTTNIPTNTTYLAPQFWYVNVAAAIGTFDFGGWYLESDQ